MELPESLKGHTQGIEAALQTPDLGSWPEGAKFHDADQPKKVAAVLIGALHKELTSARIAVLFKENHSEPGTMAKAGAQLAYLAKRDYVMTLDWNVWHGLTPLERVALVDHLLEYATTDDDDNWDIRKPDVHEFGAIVRRWGFWNRPLRAFGKDVKRATEQGDLFASLEVLPDEPLAEYRAGITDIGAAKMMGKMAGSGVSSD
jgi:hypothetical protein